MLDAYIIKNGTFKKIEERFKLKTALEEVLQMFKLEAEAKNIKLQLIKNDSLPHSIVSDQRRLKQILINLLSNALKFTTQGIIMRPLSSSSSPKSQSIKIKCELKEGSFLKFNVLDTNGHQPR